MFLNPENLAARYLCADALEQLGYQAETGLWRNAYLAGAYELRNPSAAKNRNIRYMDNRDVMPYVSASLILDYLGINFDGEKAIGLDETFVFEVTPDESGNSDASEAKKEYSLVHLYKGTLLHEEIEKDTVPEGVPVISVSRLELYDLATNQYHKQTDHLDEKAAGILRILEEYVVDTGKYRNFNIIEPLAEEKS